MLLAASLSIRRKLDSAAIVSAQPTKRTAPHFDAFFCCVSGRKVRIQAQPAGECGQWIDQQQNLQPLAAAGQTVFHRLAVAMGFQITKCQVDLHPLCTQIYQLPCAGCL